MYAGIRIGPHTIDSWAIASWNRRAASTPSNVLLVSVTKPGPQATRYTLGNNARRISAAIY